MNVADRYGIQESLSSDAGTMDFVNATAAHEAQDVQGRQRRTVTYAWRIVRAKAALLAERRWPDEIRSPVGDMTSSYNCLRSTSTETAGRVAGLSGTLT